MLPGGPKAHLARSGKGVDVPGCRTGLDTAFPGGPKAHLARSGKGVDVPGCEVVQG